MNYSGTSYLTVVNFEVLDEIPEGEHLVLRTRFRRTPLSTLVAGINLRPIAMNSINLRPFTLNGIKLRPITMQSNDPPCEWQVTYTTLVDAAAQDGRPGRMSQNLSIC